VDIILHYTHTHTYHSQHSVIVQLNKGKENVFKDRAKQYNLTVIFALLVSLCTLGVCKAAGICICICICSGGESICICIRV